MTNDNQTVYNNLTRASYLNALAETQGLYLRAIATDDEQGQNTWNGEVARISNILENWETLSVEML